MTTGDRAVGVRAAGSADVARVQHLVDEAFSPYIPRLGERPMPMDNDYARLVDEGRCWVAVDAGRIVGVAQLRVAADHVEVETLAVAPGARGAGVGGRLLAFAEQQARAHGLPEVRLCTNQAMTENLAYYPRRGFRETHRETRHGFHRVFFAKPVATSPFLLDIDGTLVDSLAVVEAAWRDVAARFGADPDAILRVCHGRRDEDVVAEFFPPPVHAAAVGRIAAFELEQAAAVVAMPGAREFLAGLPHGGWAAVTSGSRRLMTARLIGAGLPVPDVLITADDVRYGKPHPEGYLAAAARLGVDIRDCVVVEDSPTGVAAGRAAGAFVVGLATDPAGLPGADVVVGSLSEVAHVTGAR